MMNLITIMSVVPTFIGFGFVLPNYFLWHTPFDKFKRIEEYVVLNVR